MTPKLYIVNLIDRPCERLIAEERDGSLFYINPQLREAWKDQPMSMQEATPLEHFGVQVQLIEGFLAGVYFHNRVSAHYPDGKTRNWQGSPVFRFEYNPDFSFSERVALGE